MKLRALFIAFGVLVVAGSVGTGVAFTVNDDSANPTATYDDSADPKANYNLLEDLVAQGEITPEQRAAFESWADSEPVVTFNYVEDYAYSWFSGYQFATNTNLRSADGDLPEQGFPTSVEARMTDFLHTLFYAPQAYFVNYINTSESIGMISAEDAVVLQDWVSRMPEWFSNQEQYDSAVGNLLS